MSLLRLLTAGRSLVGMKEITSRYRMRTPNLLPKFISPKNPFAVASKTVPAKTAPPKPGPAAVSPVPAPASSGPEPVKMETAPLFDCKPKPAAAPVATPPVAAAEPRQVKPAAKAPARVEPKPAAPAAIASPKKPAPISSWVKKINPLSYLPSRDPAAKKSARPARAPVQGELSLEKVKVVRNDLSDSDVEIVTVRPAASVQVNRPFEPAMTGTEPAWNRLTSGLLTAGQTLMH